MPNGRLLQPDAQELLLCNTDAFACETYLFEPGAGEEKLGWLFAAVQTDNRNGVGSELLDTIITAIQREYYREPTRAPSTSFEMALHQANLILHDMAEQGMRDWMPSFQATVVALAKDELHISVAGLGQTVLIRKNSVTDISTGLAQVPITNPLQTFSQVASGAVSARDMLVLSTNNITTLFAEPEIARIATEQSAERAAYRFRQRYAETNQTQPLAMVAIMMTPQYGTATAAAPATQSDRVSRGVNREHLLPRQPLLVRRGTWQKALFMLQQSFKMTGAFIKNKVWPSLKSGSTRSSRAIVEASKSTGKNIHSLTQKRSASIPSIRSMPQALFKRSLLSVDKVRHTYTTLPKSSKVFAVMSLVLVFALVGSLLLLQQKRAADAEIQQASEALHQAKTKVDAAKTALIYDNRDQAEGLLNEARQSAESLIASTIYVEESHQLLAEIEQQFDRLQRVSRVASSTARTIGDFSKETAKNPQRLFLLGGNLYTYDPNTNAIVMMTLDGATSVVHETTQGVGFFADGTVHNADKTIVLTTEPAGIALFDSKDNSLANQEISFTSNKPSVTDTAVFGNRLYVLDKSTNNIFSYNKTLRGYSSPSPWILDPNFPSTTITSFGVDGNIYTLHQDGSLRKLFKGEPADFTAQTVEPALSSAARLITSDELRNLYIIDPNTKRVVIFDKKGLLVKQILVEFAEEFSDAAVSPDEDLLYVLDGTRVLEVSLAE